MARTVRKSGVKEVPLSEIKDDLSRYLRVRDERDRYHASWQTGWRADRFRIGEDWFEYRLEHDPRFLRRIEQARNSLRSGRGIKLEDLEAE